MQFHAWAPWLVFFPHGKVYRMGELICSPGGGGNYPPQRGTRPAERAKVQEWLGRVIIATTRLSDRRQSRPEEHLTWKVEE
jgi:hypothetical protein